MGGEESKAIPTKPDLATKALTFVEQFTTYDGLMESVVNDSLKPVSLKYSIGLAAG